MGICKGILDSAIEAAEDQNATAIREIKISVGELSEVVEYALQFAFESLAPGTLAEGGTLTFAHIKAASRCPQCGTEFEHGAFDAVCPECDNPFNENIRGRELRIDSIEIDAPDGTRGAPAPSSSDSDEKAGK